MGRPRRFTCIISAPVRYRLTPYQLQKLAEVGYTARAYDRKVRLLEMYGNTCACCGKGNPVVLTLDHVQDNGAIEREDGHPNLAAMEAVANYDPARWQILCFCCNHEKRLKNPGTRGGQGRKNVPVGERDEDLAFGLFSDDTGAA